MRIDSEIRDLNSRHDDDGQRPSAAISVRRAVVISLAAIYTILWAGGVASHTMLGSVGPEKVWLAPLFLFVAGIIVLAGAYAARDLFSLAGVALFGFAVEAAGVRFGVPFGGYVYTETLEPMLFGVPLVMAFAWMTLVAYAAETLRRTALRGPWKAAAGALWVTAIDLVIDPLAAGPLGYWHWDVAGAYYGVPATNFAGWLATGLCAFLVFRPARRRNPLARPVGLSIIFFFTLISLAHGLHAPALFGLALLAADLIATKAALSSRQNA